MRRGWLVGRMPEWHVVHISARPIGRPAACTHDPRHDCSHACTARPHSRGSHCSSCTRLGRSERHGSGIGRGTLGTSLASAPSPPKAAPHLTQGRPTPAPHFVTARTDTDSRSTRIRAAVRLVVRAQNWQRCHSALSTRAERVLPWVKRSSPTDRDSRRHMAHQHTRLLDRSKGSVCSGRGRGTRQARP